jgi:hypothetical protein
MSVLFLKKCCELDPEGNVIWRGTCGLAGVVARAAVEKHWLRQYFGEQGYAAFLRSYFSWPSGTPKSKNAFDKDHVSEKDKVVAETILPKYGFTSSQIDTLLELK